MKLALQKDKRLRPEFKCLPWLSCSPFVENSRAVLIHRPRTVTTHKIGSKYKSHIAIGCWCGNSMTGTTKFTFLDAPPEGKLLCARCEGKATEAGLTSASSLAGRHVHVGGVVAVRSCCNDGKDAP